MADDVTVVTAALAGEAAAEVVPGRVAAAHGERLRGDPARAGEAAVVVDAEVLAAGGEDVVGAGGRDVRCEGLVGRPHPVRGGAGDGSPERVVRAVRRDVAGDG